jgi:Spy/CpxP family protein refolding chaperone
MKRTKLTTLGAAIAVACFGSLSNLSAQEGGNPPPTAGGGQGSRGGGNRAEFRQQMQERLKTQLKVSDEEWAVIQPLLEKVRAAQREAGAGRFGGMRGGGRRGAAAGAQQGNQRNQGTRGGGGSPQAQALQAALENENASPEEIKAKLRDLREARKKAAEDLAQARKELQGVLTVRQEAVLVMMGVLD